MRWAWLLLLGLLIARPAAAAPVFKDTACDLSDVADVLSRLRCGTVSVPRDHDLPDAGSYALSVVVVGSAEQPVLPDPVIYISGGPGSPLTRYAGAQARRPYAPHRDLILVDQRGTGRSEPDICRDRIAAMVEDTLIAAIGLDPEADARRAAGQQACRDAAIARGIDLTQFGTTVTAKDLDQVRQALGVTHWNVVGESYGTAVAMALAAQHPDTIRTLVLDSVYPADPVPPWSGLVARARNALFAELPGLAEDYDAALARLRDAPIPLDRRLSLTTALFEAGIANLIYYPPNYPGLPRLIGSVRDGDGTIFAAGLAAMLPALATQDIGLHHAVECRDRAHFRSPPPGLSVLDRLQLYGACDAWGPLGPPPPVPLDTDVPTLILAGAFDPVAGPAEARRIADLIGPAAKVMDFPRLGHNVRAFSACGRRIVAEFITDPGRALRTSCTAERPPIRFQSSATRSPRSPHSGGSPGR